ncbi:MAG: DUF3726 domain-containing protein [Salaquimonas sp.]
MRRSLNEVTSELRKASLGAGFPVGHAEDLSKAAACLIDHGHDGTAALLQGLEVGFEKASSEDNFNTARDGTALFEILYAGGAGSERSLIGVYAPALLIGVGLQFAKTYQCSLILTLNNEIEVQLGQDQLLLSCPFEAILSEQMCQSVNIQVSQVLADAIETKNINGEGVLINENLWLEIKTLAAKTYVPASEASRLKGAGASVNDND